MTITLIFRCTVDFKIVAEPKYKEECSVDVRHICEDYVHVPYPKKPDYDPPPPPHDAYGPPEHHPGPGHHHTASNSDQLLSDNYGAPSPLPQLPDSYGSPRALPISMSESYAVAKTPQLLSDSYGVPLASPLGAHPQLDTSDVNILAAQLFSRTKRNAQREDFSEGQMRDLLTTAIMKEIKSTTDENLFKSLSNMFSKRAKQMKQELDTRTTTESPNILGASFEEDFPFLEKEIMDEIRRRKASELGRNTTSTTSVSNSSLGGSVVPEQVSCH